MVDYLSDIYNWVKLTFSVKNQYVLEIYEYIFNCLQFNK